MSDVTITHRDEGSHGVYFAHVEGSGSVGRLTWTQANGIRVAQSTLVPTEIGRRGVAARLVEALMDDARKQGFRVEPACSYVAAKFDKHPDWEDLRA